MSEYTINEPCEVLDSSMKIYVEVRNGRVREIRPLSSSCPVKSSSKVTALNDVSTAQSIHWLETQMQSNQKIADDAVMALSFHAKDEALAALIKILEDKQERHDNREQAMFWLVQSDYDEAYAYLDRLLD